MASHQIYNSDHQISIGPFGNSAPGVVGDGEGSLIINGNLVVRGTTSGGNTTMLDTDAPFVVAGANNPGPLNPLGYGNLGLVVQTSGANILPAFAALQFNGNANVWQVSSNTTSGNTGAVGSYANILTSLSEVPAAGSNTQIQFNANGVLGANSALTFDSDTLALGLSGTMALSHQANTPANAANTTVLYADPAGSGGSGLYFVDSNNTQDELVSKSKAIVFSIIF